MSHRTMLLAGALLLSFFIGGQASAGGFSCSDRSDKFTGDYVECSFGTGNAVNDFTFPKLSCPVMTVVFDEANDVGVTMYSIDKDDDTLAEIEAGTSMASFTQDSENPRTVVSPKSHFSFVVDNDESSGTSRAYVRCASQSLAGVETRWFKGRWQGQASAAATAAAFPETDSCLAWNEEHTMDNATGCASVPENFYNWVAAPLLLTRITANVGTHDDADDACQFCLSEDAGVSCIAGTTLNVPDTDEDPAGNSYTVRPNTVITPSQTLTLAIGQGDFQLSGTADCVGTLTYGSIEVWGVPLL